MGKKLTYKEYLQKLDEMHTWENIGNKGDSPLKILSEFSNEYPETYARYSQAMRAERDKNYLERERILREGEFLH